MCSLLLQIGSSLQNRETVYYDAAHNLQFTITFIQLRIKHGKYFIKTMNKAKINFYTYVWPIISIPCLFSTISFKLPSPILSSLSIKPHNFFLSSFVNDSTVLALEKSIQVLTKSSSSESIANILYIEHSPSFPTT